MSGTAVGGNERASSNADGGGSSVHLRVSGGGAGAGGWLALVWNARLCQKTKRVSLG